MSEVKNKDEIENAIARVCNHSIFERSPRNVRLLQFLSNEALKGNDVKEHIIGLELFAHYYDPEKNDGKVRVYMFNLRKKLKEYYQTEGQDDKVVLSLEKGQYNLSFQYKDDIARAIGSEPLLKINLRKKHLLFAGLLIAMACIVWLVYPKEKTYLWEHFFASNTKNICVVADHLMLEEKRDNGRWQSTFMSNINSENDLINYINENNVEELRATDYTVMTKMAPFAMHILSKWFSDHNSSFEVRLESEFRLEEIRNHNIIYVGQFKTMKTSKALFLRDSERFDVLKDGFVSSKDGVLTEYNTQFKGNSKTEYAMVSYALLENDNRALYLTSNNDIGTLATVRNFTNKKWLKQFFTDIPNSDTFFNAIFEVSGMRRTDTSCKRIELEVL